MSKTHKYKILELKKKYGLTFEEMATFCQVSNPRMQLWAKIKSWEDYSVPADKLRLLAELFGVKMEYMYNVPVKVVRDTKAVKAVQKVKKVSSF